MSGENTTYAEFLRDQTTGQIYPFNPEALKQNKNLQVVRGRVERIKDEATGKVTNNIVVTGKSSRGETEATLRAEARTRKEENDTLRDTVARLNHELEQARAIIQDQANQIAGTLNVSTVAVKHEDQPAFDTELSLEGDLGPEVARSEILIEPEDRVAPESSIDIPSGVTLEDELLALTVGDKG